MKFLNCTNFWPVDRVKLTELFAHEKWANKELLQAAGDSPSERFIELMSHILFAQTFWINRVNGNKNLGHPWDSVPLDKMSDCIQDNYEEILQLVKLKGFDEIVKYKNSKGEEYSNSTIDILMHLLLHSQYHRGQIASEIKASGNSVPGTDYIVYKR